MKNPEDRRKQHKIGFTPKEWQLIEKIAANHHMTTTDFIRWFMLKSCDFADSVSCSNKMRKTLFNVCALLHCYLQVDIPKEGEKGTDTPD